MGRNRTRPAEAVWCDRLARFLTSDLSVAQFCQQERVSVPSFYQWRRRLQAAEPSTTKRRAGASRQSSEIPVSDVPSFVPVNVTDAAFTEVEFPNGVRVRVPATNAEALRIAISTGNPLCREDG